MYKKVDKNKTLGARIICEFRANNLIDTDSLKLKPWNNNFDKLVKWLIKEEGLFGIVYDANPKIISIEQVIERG